VEHDKDAPFLPAAHAHTLVNEAAAVRDDLWIVGLDDALAGKPRIDAIDAVPPGVATLAIFHSPSLFSTIADRVDLALAGHTHGGQVRLPLLGAIIVPPESGPFIAGWYRMDRAQLYVSRGIGTSVLPIRFLCRPEVALFHITPATR
jgi:predicted MPP superfamily phosphohydrolase